MLPLEVEAFVSSQRVARLATVDADGRPHIVPICFACANGVVYSVLDAKPKRVPVRELRRVRNLLARPDVQVLVDRWDEDWTKLAYVQLRGRASLLEEGLEHEEALRLIRERYPQYVAMGVDGAPVIRVAVESYVAWDAIQSK